MAEEENNEAEEAVEVPEVPAMELEAEENAEAQADSEETEA